MRCAYRSPFGQCDYEDGHEGSHRSSQVITSNVMGGAAGAATLVFPPEKDYLMVGDENNRAQPFRLDLEIPGLREHVKEKAGS